MKWLKAAAAALSMLGVFGAAQAEDYPSKPIRVLVSAAPGGVLDILARSITERLAKNWNAQFVVENRGGANNQVATEALISAPPDGYTLMVTAEATMVINPFLYTHLPYNPDKDLTPITGLASVSHALVVRKDLDVKSVADFLALAKAKPNTISFGNFGIGSTGHLNMETLQQMTGVKLIAVQYKGAAPAVNDIMGNHLDAMFIAMGTAEKFAKSGKVKILGVGAKARFAEYPDVPTIGETVPGFEAHSWFALVGPAHMPKPIVDKINAGVAKVFAEKEFQDKLLKPQLFEPMVSSQEDFLAFIKSDAKHWKAAIDNAHVKLE